MRYRPFAFLFVLLFVTFAFVRGAVADEPKATKAKASERVNIEEIKERYWAHGNEEEMVVVQNRLYSKQYKPELGVFYGVVNSDPFLNVNNPGISLGFHFSEYWAVHLLGWKNRVSPSSALTTFEQESKYTTNTNEPKQFLGAELAGSLLYGKLSLLGKKIIYADFHFVVGGGSTKTESGSYVTGIAGIGQQIYLAQWMSLRMDYRLMPYKERILEKVKQPIGQEVGRRWNVSSAVTVGLTFLANLGL